MRKKIKILFLAASPIDSTRLRLDEELREIKKRILMAPERDRFELISESAVTYDDLQRALLRYKPDIVHFSGHGNKTQGIVLEDCDGNSQLINKPQLIELFKILKDNIRIVVLNACYSGRRTVELSEIIDHTVAVKTTISDEAAIAFATSFYQGLAHGRLVKEAFDLAINDLKTKGVVKSKLPELLVRRGVKDAPMWSSAPIRMITQIIGGIILIVAIFFTGYIVFSQRPTIVENSNTNSIPAPTHPDPKIEERYREAAKRLVSSQDTIERANAIYSLRKFASDPGLGYYDETIRTLADFIRVKSKPTKDGNDPQDERISCDIQAAIEVIGWRKYKLEGGESQRLDLSGAYLRRVDLKHVAQPEVAHLEGAQLIKANLERAMLREVNLENAILRGANLRKASLYKANLQGADLRDADLRAADLQWAKGITPEQIKEAKNWEKAVFSEEFENKLRANK